MLLVSRLWITCRFPRPRQVIAAVVLLTLIAASLGYAGMHLWADRHFRTAQTLLEQYRLAQAYEHIGKSLKVWPRSYRTQLLAGQIARRAGDHETAEGHFRICEELMGIQTEAIILERLLLRAQAGDVDAVYPALRDKAEREGPEAIAVMEAMARGYLHIHRFAEAHEVISRWRLQAPNDLHAILFLAWVREQLGPREEAVQLYRQVVELDDEQDDARLRLANLLLERSQPIEAADHLAILARRMPTNLAIRVRLARCRYDQGLPDEARSILEGILAEDPDYAPALTVRGRIALSDGEHAAAEKYLRRAAELDKTEYQALYLLHDTLQKQEKMKEADEVRRRLDRLEEDLRRVHEIVAEKLVKTPNDPNLHVEMGKILLRTGDGRGALNWFFKALAKEPRFAPAHLELAAYFEKNNDPKRAAYHRRMVGADTIPAIDGRP